MENFEDEEVGRRYERGMGERRERLERLGKKVKRVRMKSEEAVSDVR